MSSMKKVRIAINGLGRIGRAFMRRAHEFSDFDIVAVNDLGDVANLAYLLKYDTVYGQLPYSVSVEGDALIFDHKPIHVYREKDPQALPWKELDIDIIVESTGAFTDYGSASLHIQAGAKRVVISAPAHGDGGETILSCVNDEKAADVAITSNASCTTNAVSPLITILSETIGIEKALLNTAHAYTASQAIVDSPSKKDMRLGRAGAHNIIPSATGAAIATTKAHRTLEGKFDGIAMRVPVAVGSIVDLTFIARRATTVNEVNNILKRAAKDEKWQGIFTVTDEPIVSSDIVGALYGSIADLSFTRVADGNLVKVLAWYDNEVGYAETLIRHIRNIARYL